MKIMPFAWVRLSSFCMPAVAALFLATSLSAQYPVRDGHISNRDPYLFAAADFGIEPSRVTFAKDIAPILQRSCQSCHRPGGGAPMSFMNYEEVRPWAAVIKYRTAIRDRMGAMPPFYVERGIGIQRFKNDISLSDEELAKIQAWADNGAPLGNPSDLPAPRHFSDDGWSLGEPDLVLRGPSITMPAVGPDQWGDIGLVPTGLTTDRWVRAVEVREVNDIPVGAETVTVGGRYIFHHMTYASGVLNDEGTAIQEDTRQGWPIHEVGRNPDIFAEGVGMLLQANSALHLNASHLHPTGWRETTGHLEFGFFLHPEGYEPEFRRSGGAGGGNGTDIDVRPNLGGQEFHAYRVLDEHTMIMAFEPHLHAPGVRMCLEAIWGNNRFTLNCVGYDHNWVKQYVYEEDAAPLLPKGTVLHTIGYVDTTADNPNLADTRNWAGGGRRSVSNMFIDLGQTVRLTEEQFQAKMAQRRASLRPGEYDIGCPLCWAPPIDPSRATMARDD
jgi:hypothetical protein